MDISALHHILSDEFCLGLEYNDSSMAIHRLLLQLFHSPVNVDKHTCAEPCNHTINPIMIHSTLFAIPSDFTFLWTLQLLLLQLSVSSSCQD